MKLYTIFAIVLGIFAVFAGAEETSTASSSSSCDDGKCEASASASARR